MEMMTGRMYPIRSEQKTLSARYMFLGLMLVIMLSALGHVTYLLGGYLGSLLIL